MKFPIRKAHISSSLVVEFTSPNSGLVLRAGNGLQCGFVKNDFEDASNPDTWCPYIEETEAVDESKNNGGKTDYYQISSALFEIDDFDDFAEWRNLNGFQFNMGKVMWTFNVGRHSGTDYTRDLNKIIHYANKELKRIERKEKQDANKST